MTRAHDLASQAWLDDVDSQARDSTAINSWNIEVLKGTSGPQALVNTIVDTLADTSGLDVANSSGESHKTAEKYVVNEGLESTDIQATSWTGSGSLANSSNGTYTWKEINTASNDGAFDSSSTAYSDYQSDARAGWQVGGNANSTGCHMYLDNTASIIDFESVSAFTVEFGIRIRGDCVSGGRFVAVYIMTGPDHYFGMILYNATPSSGSLTGEGYLVSTTNPSFAGNTSVWGHDQWHDYKLDVSNYNHTAKTFDVKFYIDGSLIDTFTGLACSNSVGIQPVATTLFRYGKHTDNQSGQFAEMDHVKFTIPGDPIAMSLETNNFTADAAPDELRVLAELEGVGEGENLVIRSEEFETGWTTSDLSVTTDATIDPIGGSTADKIVENTANQAHELYQNATIVSGQVYSFSCHAKADSRSLVKLSFRGNVQPLGIEAVFDLSSETYVDTSYGTPTNKAFSITSLGAGWYRCSVTGVIPSETDARAVIRLVETGTTEVYSGNGSSGLFIWGAQLDQGASASTYVKTGATSTGAVAVIGRDVEMFVSRNGGTNFTGTAENQIAGLGGNRAIVVGVGDVSADPSGTTCRSKLTAPAGKEVRVHKLALQADKGLSV